MKFNKTLETKAYTNQHILLESEYQFQLREIMAHFNTHLNIATAITGLASASLLSAGHIDLNSSLWLWFVGTLGGLLPDIDSDNSTTLDTLFHLFTLAVILLLLLYMTAEQYGEIRLVKLLLIPLLTYVLIEYLLRSLFEKLTVHRGHCHSLSFLLLCALISTQLTYRLCETFTNNGDMFAWLTGTFIFSGGVIHLLLDEIFSVDLANARLKRSFGSALKIADFKNKRLTLLTIASIIALVYISPSPVETINTLSNWSKLKF